MPDAHASTTPIFLLIGQRRGLEAFCVANRLAATVASFVTIATPIDALPL